MSSIAPTPSSLESGSRCASPEPQRSSADLVPRERLLRHLAEDDQRVIVLCAPSGFGKSVLLRQWAEQDRRPAFEVLLGPQHNDPTVLVEAITKQLSRLEPFPIDLDEVLLAPIPDLEKVVIPRLVSVMADREHEFILTLDELEQIESPDALRVIAALCDGMPSGAQLALASRTEIPIGIGRLRASRRLTELGRKDLTMTKRECAELLATIDITLTPPQLDSMVRRTEGWPAVLYLAGLALTESSDLGRSLEQFTGDDRVVVDYLREEFLAPVSSNQAVFLRRSSILERFNGALCDFTLGREGSSLALEELSRANMLLIPLDSRGEWYRLHPLLRDMLLAELQRTEPALVPEMHRRASEWWSARGENDQAIHHAIESDTGELAGNLLFAAVPEYTTRGRTATISGWLKRLGPDNVAKSPGACLTAAWADITLGRGPEAERWLAIARHLLSTSSPRVDNTAYEVGIALAEALMGRDGLASMRQTVKEVEPLLSEDDPWRAVCALLDGAGLHLLGGDRDLARARLRESARRGSVGAPDVQVMALAQLAILAEEGGHHQTAVEAIAHARAQIDRTGIGECPSVALSFAVSALTFAARGAVELARNDLQTGLRLLAELDSFCPWYEVETKLTLARASARLGKVAQAEQLLASAFEQLADVPDALLLRQWIEETWDQLGERPPEEAGLTLSELKLLQFLPDHLSFPQIAGEMYLSTNTVKTHARSIYRKLGAASRREAVQRARQLGLLSVP